VKALPPPWTSAFTPSGNHKRLIDDAGEEVRLTLSYYGAMKVFELQCHGLPMPLEASVRYLSRRWPPRTVTPYLPVRSVPRRRGLTVSTIFLTTSSQKLHAAFHHQEDVANSALYLLRRHGNGVMARFIMLTAGTTSSDCNLWSHPIKEAFGNLAGLKSSQIQSTGTSLPQAGTCG
jgi:hypothetical protein